MVPVYFAPLIPPPSAEPAYGRNSGHSSVALDTVSEVLARGFGVVIIAYFVLPTTPL